MSEKLEVNVQSKMGKNKLTISRIVMVIGAAVLLLTVFLPFASATEEYEKYLLESPNEMHVKELAMTNEDVVNISLFDFGRMYATAAGKGMEEGIFYLVIILLFVLFAVLTVLFSARIKPRATIVFSVLSYCMFWLIKWDFEDRGVVSNSNYSLGIAEIFCYIGIIVTIASAVAYIVIAKKRYKEKQNA